MCGDEGHAYEQCPLAQDDGETGQVNSLNNEPSYFLKPPYSQLYSKDLVERQNWRWQQNTSNPPFKNTSNPSFNNSISPSFNNSSGYNNNRNFYQNASFPNQNNRAPNLAPSKPYTSPLVAPVVSNFMNEQERMNQMMFEQMQQMQTMNSQLLAQNKLIMEQMGNLTSTQTPPGKLPSQPEVNPRGGMKAMDLRSGTHYQGLAVPSDQNAKYTDRTYPIWTVSDPSMEGNPGRTEVTRPVVNEANPVHTDRADVTQVVQPTPEVPDHVESTRPALHKSDTSHTDRTTDAWVVQKEIESQKKK